MLCGKIAISCRLMIRNGRDTDYLCDDHLPELGQNGGAFTRYFGCDRRRPATVPGSGRRSGHCSPSVPPYHTRSDPPVLECIWEHGAEQMSTVPVRRNCPTDQAVLLGRDGGRVCVLVGFAEPAEREFVAHVFRADVLWQWDEVRAVACGWMGWLQQQGDLPHCLRRDSCIEGRFSILSLVYTLLFVCEFSGFGVFWHRALVLWLFACEFSGSGVFRIWPLQYLGCLLVNLQVLAFLGTGYVFGFLGLWLGFACFLVVSCIFSWVVWWLRF